MQNLPKPSLPKWGVVLLLTAAGACLWMQFPLSAQEEKSEAPAENTEAEQPAEPPPKASPKAVELFEAARKQLRTRMYKAKIVQRLNVPNRTLEATGQIVCGQKFRMRLEFQLTAGSTKGELLQVCNGDKLWTQRTVNDVIRLTEQDVKQILREARPDEIQENLIIAEMGLGGITSLLASLDRTMVFGEPREETIDGETFFLVKGEWNEQFRSMVQANPHLKKGLPPHIPDGARVYFDANDFPRRIQYLKQTEKDKPMVPLVTLDFLDLQWLTEADVPPEAFEYQVPDRVIPRPVTDKYLEQLKR